MRIRAPSEVSTHSSLEFSDSDIESISSQLNMTEVAKYIPTPPTFPTELPQIKDEPDTPLMPHKVVNDEPKVGPMVTPTTHRDRLLYCENVVFKVEDTLFCVPKRGLVNEGVYFNNLFNLAASGSAILPPQGSSDENPFVLHGVSETHFRNFLGLIYPFCGVESPSTDEQWLGILHLATKWNFANIRENALKHLQHLFISSPTRPGDTPDRRHDPIRALAICLKYNISHYIVHQFELIITSIAPLKRNAMVGAGLDEDMIQLITEMRERWFCGKVWGAYGQRTLADEKLGLFPSREPATKIVKDSLNRCMSMSFDWLESDEIYIGDQSVSTSEEEERLAEEASVLQEQELQILDELNKKRAEEKARIRREIEEAEKCAMEEERLREEVRRFKRYEDALRVIEEEEAVACAEENPSDTWFMEAQEAGGAEADYVMQAEAEMVDVKERCAPDDAGGAEMTRLEMEEFDRFKREQAERAERYSNALKVVKEEQERRRRDG
ncbi:hypothetical protein BJ165DRAFT_1609303 [Panaeolus papilionaceus]|nr:hypothetical protein BJ165DRAFT_1609303 [Panaeolus papilionaceus]